MRNWLGAVVVALPMALGFSTFTTGCGQAQLQALAADERTAASYMTQMSGLAAQGDAATPLILSWNDKMLAVDPSSPTLQKVHSSVIQAATAKNFAMIQTVCSSGAAFLMGVAEVTSAL